MKRRDVAYWPNSDIGIGEWPRAKIPKGHADFAPTCWVSTVSGRAHNRALAPMGRGGWRSGALDDFAAPSVRRMRREEWLVCLAAILVTHYLAVMPVGSTPREI